MNLDKRQRAMLREMGVRVWSPMAAVEAAPVAVPLQPQALAAMPAPAVHAPVAIDSVAAKARSAAPANPVSPAPPARPQTAPAPAAGSAVWQMGEALALYADTATGQGARWLVLAETPASALQGGFSPFDGDAGQLLDNMLRAAKLDKAGSVMLAPLSRQATAQGMAGSDMASSLPRLVASAKPDLILVMGRLASQALLQSSEPFGKLRGQIHNLQGVQVVVTHDAPYLLRNPLDKGKAWEDLCLAMRVISG